MQMRTSILTITIKYCYSREAAFYFQRPVRIDLQSHYGKKLMKVKLRTSDMAISAKLIATLNKELARGWAMLRVAPRCTLMATRKNAEAFLASQGIPPSAFRGEEMEAAVDLIHDYLEKKRVAHAQGDEEVYP